MDFRRSRLGIIGLSRCNLRKDNLNTNSPECSHVTPRDTDAYVSDRRSQFQGHG
jgi:hypothetical protein